MATKKRTKKVTQAPAAQQLGTGLNACAPAQQMVPNTHVRVSVYTNENGGNRSVEYSAMIESTSSAKIRGAIRRLASQASKRV